MKTILTILFLFSKVFLFAQSGALDLTFGNSGMVTTSYGQCVKAHAIANDANGKIVVAGSYKIDPFTNDKNIIVVRYNPDGSVDNTFSSDGIVTADLGSVEEANAVLVQHDGKILVVGYSDSWTNYANVVLIRYTTDGLLDNTFGNNGITQVSFAAGDDKAISAVLQSDGKIDVAGSIFNGSNLDYFISRFNSDGTLDLSFGNDGFAQFDYDNENQEAESIMLQPDGKILVGGYSCTSLMANFMIARFTSSGFPDLLFGLDGKTITDLGGDDRSFSMAFQPDGKILLNGHTFLNYTTDVSLVRYNSNGTLDNTFGNSGVVITDVGGYEDDSRSIALQTDGKILVSGSSRIGASNDFTLLRYNDDGTLDSSFDNDGIVTTDFGSASAYAFASVLQQNEKIILAGASNVSIALARYQSGLATGTVDLPEIQNSELIYPNPITCQAVLEYKLLKDETITVGLYDLSGRLVQLFFEKQNELKGTQHEVLNINKSVAPGNYFVTISNGSQSSRLKIVKQ